MGSANRRYESETISSKGLHIYSETPQIQIKGLSKNYNLNRMMQRIEKFADELGHAFKSIWGVIGLLLTQTLVFFAPVKVNVYLAGALIVFDIITALIALFMAEKRESKSLYEAFGKFYSAWTSRQAFDSVPKFIYYSLLILVGYGVGKVLDEPMHCANLATGLIVYIECRSVLENADKAFETNVFPLIGKLIRKKFLDFDSNDKSDKK